MRETDFWTDSNSICQSCGQPVESKSKSITCSGCGRFQSDFPLPETLPDFFQPRQVSPTTLRESGLPVSETTYLALGGGLGSFSWVDYLRVCGASTRQVVVIGSRGTPYGRFRRLCQTSQISDQERLRSDSGARPDNLWGWPGYALSEIGGHLANRRWREAAKIGWQIFGEPTLKNTYAPRAKAVYRSIDREMVRIGWEKMFHRGEICGVRQTDDGRYAVLYRPMDSGDGRPRILIAPYLHVALGYPGITLTPAAVAYRRKYEDYQRVVQAYESHEHIYAQLSRRGGTVLLRGRGIVSARILQHLSDIRRKR